MIGKDEKNLPYNLENMSIPELEALLQQDFVASEGAAPDVDYIMAIMEVIQKKEQAQPNYQPMDAEKAWEAFQSFCNAKEDGTNSVCRFDEEEKIVSKGAENVLKEKKSKTFHRNILLAAIICTLVVVTCIPVFGYNNVIQMVAYWTAEQFGFYLPKQPVSNDSTQIPEEYIELQNAMQELGVELVIPKFPEDFEIVDSNMFYFPEEKTIKCTVIYQNQELFYAFIVKNDENQTFNRNQYEKTDSGVEIYVNGGIEHYLLSNSENNTATWYNGEIEYCIITNTSVSDLKLMLESMYEV